MTDTPLPVLKGDWIETKNEPLRIGRVRDSYWDTSAPREGDVKCFVDVTLYGYGGERIGRESPVLGGPRTYEPYLDYSEWKRVEKPAFPVEMRWMPSENGGSVARYATLADDLGDRTTAPRPRKAKVPSVRRRPVPPNSDFDPELEVRARRMAAQELRDLNGSVRNPELVDKAEALEAEALRIAAESGIER